MTYPKTLAVSVSAEDIAEAARDGDYGDSAFCPVARAVRRLPGMEDADILVSLYGFIVIDDLHVYRMPAAAMTFIRRFDGFWPVEPFDFVARYEP